MSRSLKELESIIFGKDMTDKKWLELNKEVDEVWNSATNEERQEFEDSGAGDMLGQILEFMN
ncbi:hypothetical protein [Massilistercora timonensis]|uniref:hypothetical protein n=1 Tax=Massilistercora timonensis TaxID=2086584 RepID=UPI003AB77B24